jgi:DNA processing protein
MEKPVAAVPGSVFSSRSTGCNRLISEGRAQLVTGAADLLAIYPGSSALDALTFETLTPLETRTFDALGFGAPFIEQICRDAGLTLSEATQAIGSLLMKGKVLQRGAGYLRA